MSTETTDKTLELLGLTRDELREKVIEKAVDRLLDGEDGDEDEGGYRTTMLGELLRKLQDHSTERINQTIADLAEKHVLPNVTQYIEDLTLQQTNKWGEKKGEPLAFVEYLAQQARAYLAEKVDRAGKPKDTDSYSWTGTQTRITYLVHQHLQHSISTAMKGALDTINDALAEGIAETIKIQMAEITKKLQIKVTS